MQRPLTHREQQFENLSQREPEGRQLSWRLDLVTPFRGCASTFNVKKQRETIKITFKNVG